jgi:FHS family L-fucose permease-like MFS transporter
MAGERRSKAAGGFALPFALTVSLFALWGLGHWCFEALMPEFARNFRLSSNALAATQSIYSIVYFVGAIPAALFARRIGGKIAILVGLGAIGIGSFLFYPAAHTLNYMYFLAAVTIMACGWVALEIVANPLAAKLGPPETFVWRLNLAQSFYPIGALAGMAIAAWLVTRHEALPDQAHAAAIAHPYIVLGVGVLLLAYLFEEVRFPQMADDRVKGGSLIAVGKLLRAPKFLFALAAQALSVIALVSIWSPEVRALVDVLPGRPAGLLGSSLAWMLVALGVGRFAGTALMRTIAPSTVMAGFSLGGILCALIAAVSSGPMAAIAVLAASFFISITWPTILGLAIRNAGTSMKPATALICMAGAAGGMLHQFIRVALPFPTAQLAMLLPAICFAAIAVFAYVNRDKRLSPADETLSGDDDA